MTADRCRVKFDCRDRRTRKMNARDGIGKNSNSDARKRIRGNRILDLLAYVTKSRGIMRLTLIYSIQYDQIHDYHNSHNNKIILRNNNSNY